MKFFSYSGNSFLIGKLVGFFMYNSYILKLSYFLTSIVHIYYLQEIIIEVWAYHNDSEVK